MSRISPKRTILSIASILAVLTLTLVAGCGNSDEGATGMNVATINKEAPNFTLSYFGQAGQLNLHDLKGKVVLLNFWASWCGPCKMELPDLVNLSEQYTSDDFVMVGVIVNSDPQEVRSVIDQFGIPYSSAVSTEAVSRTYGVESIPTTYLIDRDGVIRYRHVGAKSRSTFERDILRLLQKT